MTNNELPAFRVEFKIFTRFIFKLVFRVSGSKGVHDFHVIFR